MLRNVALMAKFKNIKTAILRREKRAKIMQLLRSSERYVNCTPTPEHEANISKEKVKKVLLVLN
jgi:hypothetical protein